MKNPYQWKRKEFYMEKPDLLKMLNVISGLYQTKKIISTEKDNYSSIILDAMKNPDIDDSDIYVLKGELERKEKGE